MLSFLKVQAASIAGSVLDYLLTILLVSGLHWGYVLASLSGNILGAATLFVLCRNWIFRPEKGQHAFADPPVYTCIRRKHVHWLPPEFICSPIFCT